MGGWGGRRGEGRAASVLIFNQKFIEVFSIIATSLLIINTSLMHNSLPNFNTGKIYTTQLLHY